MLPSVCVCVCMGACACTSFLSVCMSWSNILFFLLFSLRICCWIVQDMLNWWVMVTMCMYVCIHALIICNLVLYLFLAVPLLFLLTTQLPIMSYTVGCKENFAGWTGSFVSGSQRFLIGNKPLEPSGTTLRTTCEPLREPIYQLGNLKN